MKSNTEITHRLRSALMVCSHPNSNFLNEESRPVDDEDLRFKASVFLNTICMIKKCYIFAFLKNTLIVFSC